jgi:uncharacterized protein YggE
MKSALLAALILAAALVPALGQTSPRTLTMNGEGEVRAAPDSVTLSAGVTSQAPSAAMPWPPTRRACSRSLPP